jgi:hypothetical protein
MWSAMRREDDIRIREVSGKTGVPTAKCTDWGVRWHVSITIKTPSLNRESIFFFNSSRSPLFFFSTFFVYCSVFFPFSLSSFFCVFITYFPRFHFPLSSFSASSLPNLRLSACFFSVPLFSFFYFSYPFSCPSHLLLLLVIYPTG